MRKKYVVDDRVNYMPGGFGIGKEPENLEGDIAKDGNAGKSSKKQKKKNAKNLQNRLPVTLRMLIFIRKPLRCNLLTTIKL